MRRIMKAALRRLKEPSTAAGVAVLAVALGAPAYMGEALGNVVVAVAGLAAILMPEHGGDA